MTPSETAIITKVMEAGRNVKRACWWMNDIDRDEAQSLGLIDKVQTVLNLLQKIDNITKDIVITIKQ